VFKIDEFIALLQRAKELGAEAFDYAHYPESSNKPLAQRGAGWRTLYSIRFWGEDYKETRQPLIDGAGYTLMQPFEQAIKNLEIRRGKK